MAIRIPHIPNNIFRLPARSVAGGTLAFAGVAAALLMTAMPVETGWTHTDVDFSRLVAVLAVAGAAVGILRKTALRLNGIDWNVLALYGYAMLRFYTDAAYPADSIALHATLTIGLYFSFRLLLNGMAGAGKAIAALIFLIAGYEAICGSAQSLTGGSRHPLYLLTGTFLNPGPYSAYPAIGLALAALWIKNPQNILPKNVGKRARGLFCNAMQTAAVIFGAVIILTMSRTAFLAAGISLTIICGKAMRRRIWFVVAGIIAFCALLYFMKPGSADGRFVINRIGAHCVALHPLFGNGAGSFFATFADTTAALSRTGSAIPLQDVDVLEYAFNDWLRIAVEFGAAGLLLAIIPVATALHRLWKDCGALFLVMLTLLVFSLFSYPMEMLPYRIIFTATLALASSLRGKKKQRHTGHRHKTAAAILSAAAVAIPVPAITFVASDKIRRLADAQKEYSMMSGIDDTAFIKDYRPLLPHMEENPEFIFEFARLLAKDGRHNESNEMLRRGARISNDPMFAVVQGNNYLAMGCPDPAEMKYIEAHHTMPNRIYPLYKLMKLKEASGYREAALRYAVLVRDFRPKVTSPATRDIHREAEETIAKLNTATEQ